jgi:hypothetical protein
VPETPDGFWKEITFQSKVEQFINTFPFPSRICFQHYCLNTTPCRWPCCSTHSCSRDGMDAITRCSIASRISLKALPNSLFQVINICRTRLVHHVFDVAPEKVIWCRKIRRAGGPVDVPETRNESAWKHLPESCHGNPCWVSSCSDLLKPQWIKLMKI